MILSHMVDGVEVRLTQSQYDDLFHVPSQEEIDSEREVQIQRNTDDLLQGDRKFRVMAELIFDTLKAGKTGDYSTFKGVINPATFRAHIVKRFRNL